jgi:hypothetical protein
MVDRIKTRGGPPPQGGGGLGPQYVDGDDGFMAWLQSILSMGDQYQMDENDIAAFANYMLMQQGYNQQQEYDLANRNFDQQNREIDYKMDYNNFLRDELGYKGDQLAFAREQFEFQSGPEFEFYKQERGMQNQERTMLHETTMQGYEAQKQQSADDLLRSANYLQQQRYGTEAAGYNRDIARYQAQQAMGMAPNPRNEYVGSLAKLVGY